MEYIPYFLIFWIGWFCSSVWTYIFSMGVTAVTMKNVTYAMCCFIKLMHENALEFMKIKYNKLENLSVPQNNIKLMRIQDEEAIRGTQKVLINLMLEKYPKGFSHLVKFNNWRGMLLFIQENQGERDV